jgi:hypothetical protein
MASLWLVYNGPIQTTAAPVKVTTGTSIKTMLQLQPSATLNIKIIEWGYSFDGFSAALPGNVELIETTVAATVTAYAQADITPWNADALSGTLNVTTNLIQVGTANSGYTATVEGSVTTLRNLDMSGILTAPTTQFVKQFPLGREPVIQAGKFARIRATFGSAVNMLCYMILEI